MPSACCVGVKHQKSSDSYKPKKRPAARLMIAKNKTEENRVLTAAGDRTQTWSLGRCVQSQHMELRRVSLLSQCLQMLVKKRKKEKKKLRYNAVFTSKNT